MLSRRCLQATLLAAYLTSVTNEDDWWRLSGDGGTETPLNVLELLWVNLIMDAMAALGANCSALSPNSHVYIANGEADAYCHGMPLVSSLSHLHASHKTVYACSAACKVRVQALVHAANFFKRLLVRVITDSMLANTLTSA